MSLTSFSFKTEFKFSVVKNDNKTLLLTLDVAKGSWGALRKQCLGGNKGFFDLRFCNCKGVTICFKYHCT